MMLTCKGLCTIALCLKRRYDFYLVQTKKKGMENIYYAELAVSYLGSYGYFSFKDDVDLLYDMIYPQWWSGELTYDEMQNALAILEMRQ